MNIIFVSISLLASVIGIICGIGGGIIIKPVMDAFHLYPAATISFMSGIVVLCMTTYSLINAKITRNFLVDKKTSPFLGIGAAVGGIAGKLIFDLIKNAASDDTLVGTVQSVVLLLLTIFTLFYSLNKKRISSLNIINVCSCILIGLALGLLSSFLGIGGGPINLIILHYFFSMKTKIAAQNSLFIIFLSQLANLIFSLVTGTIPVFPAGLLIIMAAGGVAGGIIGRLIDKRIKEKTVDRLFIIMLYVIILICIYNSIKNFI